MRQFISILAVIYLLLGLGTGLAYLADKDELAGSMNHKGQLTVETVMVGLLWPFYILDILAGYDARKLS
ncbi:MAG TPA: hypothetical protein VGD06_09880 [Acidobacteriota bacterium]